MALPQSNYTMVPNIVIENLPELKESSIRCIFAIVRATIGYHTAKRRCSLSFLQAKTGLSRQGVVNGTEELLGKGWVEREKVGQTYDYWLSLEIKADEKLVNEVDQSTKLTSRPSRPVGTGSVNEVDQKLVNLVDTYKERDLKKEDPKEKEEAEPTPPGEGSEPKPKAARKGPNYPLWTSTYLEHKPPAWKGMEAIEGNTARENCVKRAIKAYNGDESKAIERMALGLDYISQKGDEFWKEKKHSFDAILREKSMYMVEWAESALEEGFKATSPNEDPAFLNKQIAQAQTRLNIIGQPPKEWREKTGCKTVGDMTVAQKREYLDYLISRSENDGNGTTSPMSGSHPAETLARVA